MLRVRWKYTRLEGSSTPVPVPAEAVCPIVLLYHSSFMRNKVKSSNGSSAASAFGAKDVTSAIDLHLFEDPACKSTDDAPQPGFYDRSLEIT